MVPQFNEGKYIMIRLNYQGKKVNINKVPPRINLFFINFLKTRFETCRRKCSTWRTIWISPSKSSLKPPPNQVSITCKYDIIKVIVSRQYTFFVSTQTSQIKSFFTHLARQYSSILVCYEYQKAHISGLKSSTYFVEDLVKA